MIWHSSNKLSLEKLMTLGKDTMSEHIGMEFIEIGENYLKGRMPVDQRTTQPYGFLHGGASCVLAETLGSMGSALVIDRSAFICVGLEINANHIRTVTQGFVTGIATSLHLGKSTHVWDIKIYDEREKLVCVSRLTVAVVPKR
jgi:1,4-dihydroxy-2-naphthoyl-CoA hydrolase